MSTKRSMKYCGSAEHTTLSRRSFLGTTAALAGGMSGIAGLSNPAIADTIRKNDKRVIMLWLAGGASQLETFDPKPGRADGWSVYANPYVGARRSHFGTDAENGRTASQNTPQSFVRSIQKTAVTAVAPI